MTVMRILFVIFSSMTAPKMRFTSGWAVSRMMLSLIHIFTVIATGFEHTMPMRQMTAATATQTQRLMPNRPPARESVPVHAAPSQATARPQPQQPARPQQEAYRFNDLEVPAFLRKRQ